MAKWEYCTLAQVPSGPLLITVTQYTAAGAVIVRHRAESYEEGMSRLWPQLIAELGQAGWELTAVEVGAWHFKRLVQEGIND